MVHRHVRLASAVFALGAIITALPGAAQASTAHTASSGTRLYTCANATVSRPKSFVISCADGNSELTATSWSKWSATAATGTTTFGLNLCVPYCAASKISLFPKSTVALSAPESTKHGKLFSKLVVTYTLKGKKATFVQNWKGDPAFAK